MSSLVLESEPVARSVMVNSEEIVVNLADGRTLSIPVSWYPRLTCATAAERQNVNLLGGGYALEWPDLDEHIGVESLLAGRRSGESALSLQRWRDSRNNQS